MSSPPAAAAAELRALLRQLPSILSALSPTALSTTLSPLHALYPALLHAAALDPCLRAVDTLPPLLAHVALAAASDDTRASRDATAALALALCLRARAPADALLRDLARLLAVPRARAPARVRALQEFAEAVRGDVGTPSAEVRPATLLVVESTGDVVGRLLAALVRSRVWGRVSASGRDVVVRVCLCLVEGGHGGAREVLGAVQAEVVAGVVMPAGVAERVRGALARGGVVRRVGSPPRRKRPRGVRVGVGLVEELGEARDADVVVRLCTRVLRGEGGVEAEACGVQACVDAIGGMVGGGRSQVGEPEFRGVRVFCDALDVGAVLLELGMVAVARAVEGVEAGEEEGGAASMGATCTPTGEGSGLPPFPVRKERKAEDYDVSGFARAAACVVGVLEVLGDVLAEGKSLRGVAERGAAKVVARGSMLLWRLGDVCDAVRRVERSVSCADVESMRDESQDGAFVALEAETSRRVFDVAAKLRGVSFEDGTVVDTGARAALMRASSRVLLGHERWKEWRTNDNDVLQHALALLKECLVGGDVVGHAVLIRGCLLALADCVCNETSCSLCGKDLSDSRLFEGRQVSRDVTMAPCPLAVWERCFNVLKDVYAKVERDDVLGAAARLQGRLVCHAPPGKIGAVGPQLVRALWHPTSQSASTESARTLRRIVATTGDHAHMSQGISSAPQLDGRMVSGHLASASLSGTTLLPCEDSWDGPQAAFRIQDEVGLASVVKLLGVELGMQLDRAPGEEVNSVTLCKLALLPSSTSAAASKVGVLACNALLAASMSDLKQVRDGRQVATRWSSSGWSQLLLLAVLSDEVLRSSYRGRDGAQGLIVDSLLCLEGLSAPWNGETASATSGRFRGSSRARGRSNGSHRLLPDVMCKFLFSRSKDWIPLSVERLLADDKFTLLVSQVLGVKNSGALWDRVPRFALGSLLRAGNGSGLELLAARVRKPSSGLVEGVCSDALARSVLASPSALTDDDNPCLKLVQEKLSTSIPDILASRTGKVVQRIVLEFGHGRDANVLSALSSVVLALGDRRLCPDGSPVVSLLIEDHFLLVMDAVNRGLFTSSSDISDRLHCLRVLDAILNVCKASLYRFVPKVMATLKLALQIEGVPRNFRAHVCRLWGSFIEKLGPSRLGPHLGSIISILAPVLPQHHRIIVPALHNVFEHGKAGISPYLAGIRLLLTTIRHPSLAPLVELVREWNAEELLRPSDPQPGSSPSGDVSTVPTGQVQDEQFLREIDDVSCIAVEHGSAPIRAIALGRLLDILRLHRGSVVSCFVSVGDDLPTLRRRSVFGSLVRRLTTLLLHSDASVREQAWKCMGELGAVDPVHVSSNASVDDQLRAITPTPLPDSVFEISGELLRDCLVPALLRGDRTGAASGVNRTCMAIQELLRICSCSESTPTRWGSIEHRFAGSDTPSSEQKVSFKDTPAADRGALFWGSRLTDHVRELSEPYLSRPFDTSLYGAASSGSSSSKDPEAFAAAALLTLEGRGPIWVKLAAAAGDIARVHAPEWRMHLAAQLTDYVGDRGEYGPLLTAVRSVLRHNDAVSARVLPLAIMSAMDVCYASILEMTGAKGTPTRRRSGPTVEHMEVFAASSVFSFILGELTQAVKAGGEAAAAVFAVLDNLRSWRELRADEKWKVADKDTGRSRPANRRGRLVKAEILAKARCADVLSYLVDLEGASKLPLMELARAAHATRAYSRAVMYAEQHIQNIRRSGGLPTWPAFVREMIAGVRRKRGLSGKPGQETSTGRRGGDGNLANTAEGTAAREKKQGGCQLSDDAIDGEEFEFAGNGVASRAGRQVATARNVQAEMEALKLIQECLFQLEDSDGMAGIALLRQDSTLHETILDAEAAGSFDDALLCYERALASSPDDADLHCGFLRCLRTLGHWETMLAHADGLVLKRSLSFDEGESSVGRSAKALGMEAAWRLGRWDRVDDLCGDRSLQRPHLEDLNGWRGCGPASSGDVRLPAYNDGRLGGQSLVAGADWESVYGTAIGEMLARVRRKDASDICEIADRARTCLLAPAADAATEGYSRAYPFIVKLHCLADVEDTIRFVGLGDDELGKREALGILGEGSDAGGGTCDDVVDLVGSGTVARSTGTHFVQTAGLPAARVKDGTDGVPPLSPFSLALISSDERSDCTASSLHVREPILSCRRVCLELLGLPSEAAVVSLELAKLARVSGNLRAASAAAYRALSMSRVESEEWFAASTEMAQIQAARGDKTGGLRNLEKVVDRMTSVLRVTAASLAHRHEIDGVTKAKLTAWRQRLSASHVLAGKWIEEAQSAPPEEIVRHLKLAAKHSHLDGEPFYALGRFYDRLLQNTGKDGMRQDFDLRAKFVPIVLQNFSDSLRLGHRWIFEIMPRMLTVWFDFCSEWSISRQGVPTETEERVQRIMKRAIVLLPKYYWLTVHPQLMSRLLHPSTTVRSILQDLLASLVVTYPDQAVWTIAPASQLSSAGRSEATGQVLNRAMMVVRKRHPEMGSKSPVTLLKRRIRTGLVMIKHLVEVCSKTVAKEKRGRVEDCSVEFRPLRGDVKSSRVLMPTLAALTVSLPGGSSHADASRASSVALMADAVAASSGTAASGASAGAVVTATASANAAAKGHAAFAEHPVTISDVHPEALVMTSLMRPRRIEMIGSDGKRYRFLAKKETAGDMRKDSRLMDFLTVVNRLLAKERSARRRGLHIKTYAVLPLTEESGLLEWVDDLAPLRSIVREEQERGGALPEVNAVQAKYAAMDKRRFHEEWALPKHPAALDTYFMRQFGDDAARWLAARTAWTRSVAVWSMTGYVVGLGDRHGENVLIETTSGRCVHVDFAMLFDKGRQLKVPEIVPFRLTHNMVGAMGVAGYEGAYRAVCEITLGVLRAHADALMGVLEAFLHDPLADWAKGASADAADVADGAGDEGVNAFAAEMRRAVHAKLHGIVGDAALPLSIKGQVQRLLHEATSTANLAQMYLWWGAWCT